MTKPVIIGLAAALMSSGAVFAQQDTAAQPDSADQTGQQSAPADAQAGAAGGDADPAQTEMPDAAEADITPQDVGVESTASDSDMTEMSADTGADAADGADAEEASGTTAADTTEAADASGSDAAEMPETQGASAQMADGAAGEAGPMVIVHAGTLLTNAAEAPLTEQSIVIRGDRIERIEAGYIEEDGAEIIDLSGGFVMPGMIDSHVHITSELNPQQRLQTVERADGDYALAGAVFGKRTLEAGFTTVQDVGGRGTSAIYALRDASQDYDLPIPRIRAAGWSLSVTGGHGDGRQGYNEDVAHVLHKDSVCDGADDCRRAVRDQIRKGADLIKITATGGVLSNTLAGVEQQFTDDELAAIVDAAGTMGRYVTAHAHGVNGINSALEAGVHSIEHGTYLDEESIALFTENDAVLVPTVVAGDFVARTARTATWMTEPQRIKSLQVGPQMLDMLRRAHQGGVTIAFGTDSGVSPHGENARELELMVEAGMSEQEVLEAATTTAAEHIQMAEDIGTLEEGKFADLIAVGGDPLQNISELRDVDFVMKGGRVFKEEDLDGPAAAGAD
ncbi:Imidazolonepropionase [Paracoccus isoporae]|uniref:Imidazolonepropionase n=1 Tax=Paracoccus isoporae TaxID=591205 RepID=A0A1G7DGZ6_9RHOB|nr:amidohydrolase family protein [Paracoccus isoporae]SDE50868.1 Imidazolonepropionase [Paracoccus isoporae]